jgi:hypothetical protein
MKFIIAGNYDEYKRWLDKRNLDSKEYVYVRNIDTLRGYSGIIEGYFIGTYEDRYDIEDLKEHILLKKQFYDLANSEIYKQITDSTLSVSSITHSNNSATTFKVYEHGAVRYNTQTKKLEYYVSLGNFWAEIPQNGIQA